MPEQQDFLYAGQNYELRERIKLLEEQKKKMLQLLTTLRTQTTDNKAREEINKLLRDL